MNTKYYNLQKVCALIGLSALVSIYALAVQIKVVQHKLGAAKLESVRENSELVYTLNVETSGNTNSMHQLCAIFSDAFLEEGARLINLHYQIKKGSTLDINAHFGMEATISLPEYSKTLVSLGIDKQLYLQPHATPYNFLDLLQSMRLDQKSLDDLSMLKELQKDSLVSRILLNLHVIGETQLIVVGMDSNKEFYCFSISWRKTGAQAMSDYIEKMQCKPVNDLVSVEMDAVPLAAQAMVSGSNPFLQWQPFFSTSMGEGFLKYVRSLQMHVSGQHKTTLFTINPSQGDLQCALTSHLLIDPKATVETSSTYGYLNQENICLSINQAGELVLRPAEIAAKYLNGYNQKYSPNIQDPNIPVEVLQALQSQDINFLDELSQISEDSVPSSLKHAIFRRDHTGFYLRENQETDQVEIYILALDADQACWLYSLKIKGEAWLKMLRKIESDLKIQTQVQRKGPVLFDQKSIIESVNTSSSLGSQLSTCYLLSPSCCHSLIGKIDSTLTKVLFVRPRFLRCSELESNSKFWPQITDSKISNVIKSEFFYQGRPLPFKIKVNASGKLVLMHAPQVYQPKSSISGENYWQHPGFSKSSWLPIPESSRTNEPLDFLSLFENYFKADIERLELLYLAQESPESPFYSMPADVQNALKKTLFNDPVTESLLLNYIQYRNLKNKKFNTRDTSLTIQERPQMVEICVATNPEKEDGTDLEIYVITLDHTVWKAVIEKVKAHFNSQ